MIVPLTCPKHRQVGSRPSRGVTLIEVTISIVLVSTILLVSLTAAANLMRNDSERRNTNQGQQLAAQILDEVSSMDFRDRSDPVFGLESGEIATDRTTFDDVDDYNSYASTPPKHRDGTLISGYDGWSFSVAVYPADPDATGITTSSAGVRSPLRIIQVFCTAPDGATTDAATLVSNTPNDITATTSYEKWRRVKLTFPDREITVTAPLRNRPDPTY
jgi:type II secretory pathway pseudopilin PulG